MNYNDNMLYRETKFFIVKKNFFSKKDSIINIVYKLVYPFCNIYYKLLLCFMPKPKYKKKYKIAICAIFKNESLFFREWIEYHLILGVDHFYLYNNNSEDNYYDVLLEYTNRGIITLIEWPQVPGQISAYKHWYDNYRNDSQWVTFLDLDEYICPKYANSILDWLNINSKYPVIVMYWVMFGTSGRLTHDISIPLIEQYTHCWNKKVNIGKVFYNTDFEIAVFDNSMHHLLKVKWNGLLIYPFNTSGNVLRWDTIHPSNKHDDSMQINHYYSRAYDILKKNLQRGDSAYKNQWKTMNFRINQEYNNRAGDFTIFRFLLILKLKLNGIDLEEHDN